MPEPITQEITFRRYSKNKLNEERLQSQIKSLAKHGMNRTNAPKVIVEVLGTEGPTELDKRESENNNDTKYRYEVKLLISKSEYRSENAATSHITNSIKHIEKYGRDNSWVFVGDSVLAESINENAREPIELMEFDEEVVETYFSEIYEREAHIELIYDDLRLAADTNFNICNHTLLYGQPASCKTELFKAFKKWIEKEDDFERVAILQASAFTKAGLENWMLERAESMTLPEIICFDEIEKFGEGSISCLLEVMDGQSKISKMNSRIGRKEAKAKCIVWATCNDKDKLERMFSGALHSRFTHKWPCVRPSRELLVKICEHKLMRMEHEHGIDVEMVWAKAAVDLGYDKLNERDPRTIIGYLSGREKLMDGRYEKQIRSIMNAHKASQQIEEVS